MKLKKDKPVEAMPDHFFRDAKFVDLKLKKFKMDHEEPELELIDLNEDVIKVVQSFIRSLKEVKQEAQEYNEAGEKIYKLIDVQLRFYRYTELHQKFEKIDNPRKDPSKFHLKQFHSGLVNLMQTIHGSINRANEQFKEEMDVDNNVLYLFNIAQQFEHSVRFFGRVDKDKEKEAEWSNLEGFDDAESEEEVNETIDQFEDEPHDFAAKAEQQMEEELGELG